MKSQLASRLFRAPFDGWSQAEPLAHFQQRDTVRYFPIVDETQTSRAKTVPRDLITPDADLVDKLNLDSIDAIDLMVRLQELTGRKVEPEDFKSVRTINDVLNLAQRMHAQG